MISYFLSWKIQIKEEEEDEVTLSDIKENLDSYSSRKDKKGC